MPPLALMCGAVMMAHQACASRMQAQTLEPGKGASASEPSIHEAIQQQFEERTIELFGPTMLEHGATYKKFGIVFAKRAAAGERLKTSFDGKLETVNTAKEGDWVVRADTTAKERFFVPDAKFKKLYDQTPVAFATLRNLRMKARPHEVVLLKEEGFKAFKPCGRVVAVQVTAEMLHEFFPQGKFIAPWGEEMLVEVDDFLACPVPGDGVGKPASLGEVYRIEKGAFAQTYMKEAQRLRSVNEACTGSGDKFPFLTRAMRGHGDCSEVDVGAKTDRTDLKGYKTDLKCYAVGSDKHAAKGKRGVCKIPRHELCWGGSRSPAMSLCRTGTMCRFSFTGVLTVVGRWSCL